MRTYYLLFICCLAAALTACDKEKAQTTSTTVAPESITFTDEALYPEGVAWDANHNRFLVTSIHKGVVGAVTIDGSFSVFATDPHMVSAVGIHIDAKRDRVLVCNSDPGASAFSSKETTGKLAGLAAFQLSTGELIKYINLTEGIDGGHFCNDLTIDSNGTAYITDSFSPIVYRVDKNYQASVLLNDKTFSGDSFNLNGIVVKDGYLLTVKMNSGQLFKIPLDNPGAFSEVKLEQPVYAADGALWGPDGSLIVIANNNAHVGAKPPVATNKVIKLQSTDNWATAKVIGQADTGDVFATTGTIMDGNIYVIHAMLQVLFNPKTEKQLAQFEIHRYNP